MISKDQSQTLKINVGWQELRKRSAKVFEIKMKKKTWNVNERQDSGVGSVITRKISINALKWKLLVTVKCYFGSTQLPDQFDKRALLRYEKNTH